MSAIGVPFDGVAAACRVIRLREGQRLRAVVGKPCVGLLVHWAGGRSQACVDPLGRDSCPHCGKGDVPQWQAFVPIEHSVTGDNDVRRVRSLLLLGARAVASGGIESLNSLSGREVEFARGKRRRFVELQLMLEATAFEHPTCENLAVLFGAGRYWSSSDVDTFHALLVAVERMYAAQRQTVVV